MSDPPPPPGDSKNSNNDDIINDKMSGLQASVETIQAALNGAFKGLTTSLTQSVEMMSTMNDVMEMFLAASLTLKQEVTSSTSTSPPTVNLTVGNTCQFPIEQLSITVSLALQQEPQPGKEGSLLLLSSENKPGFSDLALQSGSLVALVNLQPHSADCHLQFSVALPELQQALITVSLLFPSPGTGRPIQRRFEFGVFLADQMRAQNLDDLSSSLTASRPSSMETIPVPNLRKTFRVKPHDGILLGSSFELSEWENPLSCLRLQICSFGEDGHSAVVEAQPSDDLPVHFADLLIKELQT